MPERIIVERTTTKECPTCGHSESSTKSVSLAIPLCGGSRASVTLGSVIPIVQVASDITGTEYRQMAKDLKRWIYWNTPGGFYTTLCRGLTDPKH